MAPEDAVRRSVRLLIGLPILAVGVLIGLYGLFATVYNGDARGTGAYVTLIGHRLDADLVGSIALAIALGVILVSVWLLRLRDPWFANPS